MVIIWLMGMGLLMPLDGILDIVFCVYVFGICCYVHYHLNLDSLSLSCV